MGARLLALIIKEFLALFRDKKSRMAVIVPPILQLLVFGYAATFDLEDAKLAILNEDGGVFSRDLAARFERSPGFKIVGYLRSTAEIAPLIDRRGALLVLHIGEQCAQEALGGDGCPLQVLIDGRNSNTAMLALNYVRTIVTDFNEERAEVNGTSLPARLNIRAWFNPNLESRWFIVPGIVALLAMIVTLVVTSLSVAREREAGTFDQLLVTPLHPWEILIGKAMPGLIVGVGEASLIIAVTVFWFEVPLVGKLSVLYPALIIYVLSHHRRGVDDLVVFCHPAASPARLLSLYRAGGDPLRLLHPDRQHAAVHADLDLPRSDALFPVHRPPGVPRRGRARILYPRSLADVAHRPDHPQPGHLAVPSPDVLKRIAHQGPMRTHKRQHPRRPPCRNLSLLD
jgi:ABC-type multidrug transport system, permease component